MNAIATQDAFRRPRVCCECGTATDSGLVTVEVGDLRMDRVKRRVWWKGERLDRLTAAQFAILEMLVQRAGRMVQRWAFFGEVLDENSDDKVIDVHVCRIRASFRKVDPTFDNLETCWGEGLRWRTGPGE